MFVYVCECECACVCMSLSNIFAFFPSVLSLYREHTYIDFIPQGFSNVNFTS